MFAVGVGKLKCAESKLFFIATIFKTVLINRSDKCDTIVCLLYEVQVACVRAIPLIVLRKLIRGYSNQGCRQTSLISFTVLKYSGILNVDAFPCMAGSQSHDLFIGILA